MFWKTLAHGTTFKDMENIIENLKKVNEINNPKNNEVVFEGWMARNQFENTGVSYSIDVYSEYPEYKRSDDKKQFIGQVMKSLQLKHDNIYLGK